MIVHKMPLGRAMMGHKMPLGKVRIGGKMPLLERPVAKMVEQALQRKISGGLERRK